MVSVLWPIYIRCPVTGSMIIDYDKRLLPAQISSQNTMMDAVFGQ